MLINNKCPGNKKYRFLFWSWVPFYFVYDIYNILLLYNLPCPVLVAIVDWHLYERPTPLLFT